MNARTHTIATICSGGGILEQGAIATGLTPIWGIELDPEVAHLYQVNYPDSQIIVSDVCKVDFSQLRSPDILHASPPCRRFSQANTKGESALDRLIAFQVADAIAILQPKLFTLENVRSYGDSKCWQLIKPRLEQLNYSVAEHIIDMKEWGVPQKRRVRFIATAVRSTKLEVRSKKWLFKIMLHSKLAQDSKDLLHTSYFLLHTSIARPLTAPNLNPQCWYSAIANLIENFEPSQLTNTQKKRLHPEAKTAIAEGVPVLLKRNQIRTGKNDHTPYAIAGLTEAWTVTAKLCTDGKERRRRKFADLVIGTETYSLNSRAIARIQTIPDSYILSQDVRIDGLAIGDGVPPLFSKQMYQQVWTQFLVPETVPGKDKEVIVDVNARSHERPRADERRKGMREEEVLTNIKSDIKSELEKDKLTDHYKIGKNLAMIRDRDLHKHCPTDYASCFIYFKNELGIQRRRAYQFLDYFDFVENHAELLRDRDLTEYQVRPLTSLSMDRQKNALVEVLKLQKVTHDKVSAIARRHRNNITKIPKLHGVYRLNAHYKVNLGGKAPVNLGNHWGVVEELMEHSFRFRIVGDSIQIPFAANALSEIFTDWQYEEVVNLLDRLDRVSEKPEFAAKTMVAAWAKQAPCLGAMDLKVLEVLEQTAIAEEEQNG